MTRAFLLALAVGALAACSIAPAPKSPAQAVYETEAALGAAETAAIHYTSLPHCGAGVAGLCSDPAIIAKVKSAADKAAAAVMAAQTAVRADPQAAKSGTQSAVDEAASAASALAALLTTIQGAS